MAKEIVLGRFYAMMTVCNPYSSRKDEGYTSWYSNDELMTRKDFNATAKRVAKRFAEKKYIDTLKDGEVVKVFADRDKFATAYFKKTKNHPNFDN